MTINAALAKSAVVAALGGLLFGFDTAVIAGTTDALTRTFDLSPAGQGDELSQLHVGRAVVPRAGGDLRKSVAHDVPLLSGAV